MAKEYTAKTIDEAIKLGLEDLGTTLEQVEYTVIEQPTKGIFGIGSKPAKISLSKKKTDADYAADFLDGLFSILKINATCKIEEDSEERIVIDIVATDSSSLIGYRGEVLDSFQCIAGAVANKTNEKYKRVVVDCEGYRNKREITLKNLAIKLSEKAKKTARKISLEPMNPFERRIIHSTLADIEGIKTVSEGKEPNRFISIIPDNFDPTKAERKPFNKGRNNFGHHGNQKRGNGSFKNNGNRENNGFGAKNNKFGSKPARDSRPAPKKSGFGVGVFLGNSLKNSESEENKD